MTLPINPSSFDLQLADWKQWSHSRAFPSFLGDQVFDWIYRKGVSAPDQFTNISPTIRTALEASFCWEPLHIHSELCSKDGSVKFLLKTHDALLIEMVLMPTENRTTLCISSQVGCKMGCTFCQTGKMGFKRNLSSGEILYQIHLAKACLSSGGEARKVTNIVFMGMGEPLDNYVEVVKACRVMIDPKGYGLSKNKVTVSTSGLVPEIEQLGRDLPVRLAISLHNADNEKRSEIMPITRKYSLAELKKALLAYPSPHRFGITFEYVMIDGVNDAISDAKKLVHFLHGLKARVNLIPLNHFPGVLMKASTADKLKAFQEYLSHRSIPSPIRYSRGQDISGGCGQLAAKHEDELHLDPREVHRKRRQSGKLALLEESSCP